MKLYILLRRNIFNSGDYFEDTKQGQDVDGNSINRTIKLIFGSATLTGSEEAVSDEGSEESTPGGSGDPYIHSLFDPIYKLPDAPGNCRFISTKDLDNRFLVDISIEKLTFDEQKDLLKQFIHYNRNALEKNKLTIDGYYFRNFYISNKNNNIIINLEDRTVKVPEAENDTLDYL